MIQFSKLFISQKERVNAVYLSMLKEASPQKAPQEVKL